MDKDKAPSTTVLGETHNVIPGEAILWLPVHRVQGDHAGKTSVPHNFKHGCGCGHPTTGDEGGHIRHSFEGIWEGGTNTGRYFLHVRRIYGVPPA